MSDGGKGSAPRPFSVKHEEFANNWDAIFGKKSKNTKDSPDQSQSEEEVNNNEESS